MASRIPLSVQVFVRRPAPAAPSSRPFEFLLLRRIPERGGFWQPVTGRVEPGETLEQAAARELCEETAVSSASPIDLNYTHAYPLKTEWLVNYPPGTTHNDESAFAVTVPVGDAVSIDPGEHDDFGWFTLEQCLEKLTWHGNRQALLRAAALPDSLDVPPPSVPPLPRRSRVAWNFGARNYVLGDRTLIMGILNVTPDSFSDGSRFASVVDAVEFALKLEADGADIIDIGGESTRPGSTPISADEEIRRVVPVIEKLQGKLRIPISIDTYKDVTAHAALSAGAEIVNDIGGLRFDPRLAETTARFNAGLVLMHSHEKINKIHDLPVIFNISQEVFRRLSESIGKAVESGVSIESIAVDPGVGFGKTLENNISILRNLNYLSKLNRPLLTGVSRKSFLGKILNRPNPDTRLFGTAAAVTLSVVFGSHIIRVHDVREMRDCAAVADALSNDRGIAAILP